MEEEDEGAVAHDFRAQARARASPSSTKLWDSTERVHLTVSVCLYPLQPVYRGGRAVLHRARSTPTCDQTPSLDFSWDLAARIERSEYVFTLVFSCLLYF